MSRPDQRDPLWQAHIRETVAAAPPLTQAQIAKLGVLFDYTEQPPTT